MPGRMAVGSGQALDGRGALDVVRRRGFFPWPGWKNPRCPKFGIVIVNHIDIMSREYLTGNSKVSNKVYFWQHSSVVNFPFFAWRNCLFETVCLFFNTDPLAQLSSSSILR